MFLGMRKNVRKNITMKRKLQMIRTELIVTPGKQQIDMVLNIISTG
jgi:hypothetical protein